MVSEKVLKRVKECQHLIDNGIPLRNALLEAHTDIDTYKKYKDYTPNNNGLKSDIKDIKGLESTNKVFKEINSGNEGLRKHIGRPRKYELKKVSQKISLEQKYIDKIKKESDETGFPVASIAANYVIEALKKKYKDL